MTPPDKAALVAMTLPQVSDALRQEAIFIQEAAQRVADQMNTAVEAVRAAHAAALRSGDGMREALEDIVRANPMRGHLECPQTKIARAALAAAPQAQEAKDK